MNGIVNSLVNTTLDSIEVIMNKLSNSEQMQILKEEESPIEDLITSKDYPLEMKHIVTSDRYILRVYRIPGPKGTDAAEQTKEPKPPVLVVHGIIDSSDSFVCNEEELCIPFVLANCGFDVWILNTRGNKHSRFHLEYSTDDEEFWNFSFNEVGKYDLPAVFDYIYKLTQQRLIYIGHSQGTTAFLAGASSQPYYYESRVKLFLALSPICRMTKVDSFVIKSLVSMRFDSLLTSTKQYEVLYHHDMTNRINSFLASKVPSLVGLFFSMITDENEGEINKKRLPVLMGHVPSGTSVKSLAHFCQIVRSEKFQFFDYGEDLNKEIYDNSEPPEYMVSNIKDVKIKIGLFCGKLDKFNNEEDNMWLEEQLGENVIFSKWFNTGHVGFLLPNDREWLDELIDLCVQYKREE